MKYFAAYMLLRLEGYQEPSANNIRIVISSVGIFMDEDTAARAVASLAGAELKATGPALLADVQPVEKYG